MIGQNMHITISIRSSESRPAVLNDAHSRFLRAFEVLMLLSSTAPRVVPPCQMGPPCI